MVSVVRPLPAAYAPFSDEEYKGGLPSGMGDSIVVAGAVRLGLSPAELDLNPILVHATA
jgi:hypothetical protein